jgi:hypothetical protein
MSAPVTAITPSRWICKVGPTNWHSRPAVPGSLPTSTFAKRNDQLSIGPDGGKPWFQ